MAYTKIQVVFDAAEPEKLAEFWGLALGYVVEPPPPGFATWEELALSRGLDPSEFADVSSRIDPAGEGPRLYFQRVPEGKTAKNRVHLDVHVADHSVRGPERDKLVAAKVAALEAAGGTVVGITDDARGKATVMRDPEGNEFCVA